LVVDILDPLVIGGRRDLVTGQPLIYGRSITDGCIDWDTSVAALERLARAVEQLVGNV
jgi:3-deoxy-7-phosphoheptulonate synthase